QCRADEPSHRLASLAARRRHHHFEARSGVSVHRDGRRRSRPIRRGVGTSRGEARSVTGALQGKIALVTGSGRGIGQAIAVKLASQGASVVVNDLDPGPAGETVQTITAAGGTAISCAGSVTEATFPERFVGAAIDRFGGIDIIVNNAGYTWDNVI